MVRDNIKYKSVRGTTSALLGIEYGACAAQKQKHVGRGDTTVLQTSGRGEE